MSSQTNSLAVPGSPDAILDALDPEQREVATALNGPVVVLAGAGTGKTRAITHRIAYGVRSGVYKPTAVLAVTFTARAAGEMRSRLRELGVAGVQARTFHAAAQRQLAYFWPRVIGGGMGPLVEHKGQYIAAAAERVGLQVDKVAVRDLASAVEWAKVMLISPEDYERRAMAEGRPAPSGYDHQQVARLAAAYEDYKTERGTLDFEDHLQILAGILAEHREVAEQVRSQYRHFVVDEYQDVNPLQQFLLDQWLGDRKDLCVVGDAAQTIYTWNGATPDYLLGFRRRFPQAQEIRLVRNYRSTPQVVNLANEVLRRGRVQGALDLRAQRVPGPPASFASYDDDEAEAAGVVAKIGRLVATGTRPSEIAILYRTQAQSEAFEAALADAGIGYQVRGGERFFHRKDVRDAILLLRGAARAADPDQPMPELVRDVLTPVGWSDTPPAARGAARERWDAMHALVTLADELAALGPATLATLVEELDQRAEAKHAPTVEGITLATLHAAKGLEWDAVFLAGLSEGLMPISLAETDEAVAEERRLLYVGVTRARVNLELSFSRSRTPGGRGTRKRTRFLDGVWPGSDVAGSGGGFGSRGGRSRSATQARLTGEHDVALFEELREWRREVAADRDRPAYTILTDDVLSAVAELRPSTTMELARIHGIGPAKIDQYGAAVLAIVARSRNSSEEIS